MEEDTAPPRRSDTLLLSGMRATRSSSMRFTEPQGPMEEPPVPPHRSTRSSAPPPYTPRYSAYGFMRTMCGSRTGGWSLPCVMSD
jgi:hypothetical protein